MSSLEAIRERILARDRELELHKEADKIVAAANSDAATLLGIVTRRQTADELERGMTWPDTFSDVERQLTEVMNKMTMLVEENELLIDILGIDHVLIKGAADHLLQMKIALSEERDALLVPALKKRVIDAGNAKMKATQTQIQKTKSEEK